MNVSSLYPNEGKGFWNKIWGTVGDCKGIFYKGVWEEYGLT